MSPCVRERSAGPKPTENLVARMPDGLGGEEVPELVDEDEQQQAADRERDAHRTGSRVQRLAHELAGRRVGPDDLRPIHERAGLDRIERALDEVGDVEEASSARRGTPTTASSSAAFSAHGARPPASPAARASARQRNVSASAASNVRPRPAVRSSRCGRGQPRAVGVGERVGDRHPHVRQAEVREHGAVGQAHERVHDRLRMDDDLDAVVRRRRTASAPR